MGVSKVVLNGNVLVDLTGVTVEATNLVSPNTAIGADGEDVTGSLQAKTSADLTVSGATVTAPAGVYSTDASASVASGSAATPATTITANPSISVSSSGLITASNSKTQSVTPTVSAGYVSSGTAGTITVSGSNTSQLTTQAAQTKYPSTSDQTISSGRYLTGTQTFKAVTTSNLTADNIKKDVVVKVGDSANAGRIISVTGTYEGSGGGGTPVFSYTEITLTSSTNLVTINLDAMPAVVFGGVLPNRSSGDMISSGKIYPLYFVITLQNSTFKNVQGGSKINTTSSSGIITRSGNIYAEQYGVNTNIQYTLTASSTGATLQLKYGDASTAAADDHYGIYVVGANIVT